MFSQPSFTMAVAMMVSAVVRGTIWRCVLAPLQPLPSSAESCQPEFLLGESNTPRNHSYCRDGDRNHLEAVVSSRRHNLLPRCGRSLTNTFASPRTHGVEQQTPPAGDSATHCRSTLCTVAALAPRHRHPMNALLLSVSITYPHSSARIHHCLIHECSHWLLSFPQTTAAGQHIPLVANLSRTSRPSVSRYYVLRISCNNTM